MDVSVYALISPRVEMTFVHEAGLAILLISLTLWMQCLGIAALIIWLKRSLDGDIHRLRPFRSAVVFVRLTTRVIALHGLLILLWASWYRWLCLPSWESALYFSATSCSTVGYGDVIVPGTWRLLGPLESVTGVLMCGISVSVLFALVTRLLDRDTKSSLKNSTEQSHA